LSGSPVENVIDLKDVGFSYPHATHATLHIQSFQIQRREKVFLYGPSGSGKTTLLEILAGVLAPQSGSVHLLGTDIAKLSSAGRDRFRADHIGYIFQSFNLIPYLSVEENIQLPLHLSRERRARVSAHHQSGKGEKGEKEEIHYLCTHLGIHQLLQRRVTDLSVGQQQRVAVARALLGSPGLILADEPTSSLDYDLREKFIQLLFEVCGKMDITVLFVSHDRSLEKLFSRSISFAQINQINPTGGAQ
jgi:putative ABC transport system ATP-binding protein